MDTKRINLSLFLIDLILWTFNAVHIAELLA